MENKIRIFEEKIEEYFLSLLHTQIHSMPDKSFLSEWPLYKFSIVRFHNALKAASIDEQLFRIIGDKLIDIKLHFAYLLTVHEHFYKGATLIVGENEIEKLNPNTISLLRGVHYRVYLLSILIEQILDLLYLLLDGKSSSFKKNKWGNIVNLVRKKTGDSIISMTDESLLSNFKDYYRNAEFHKFSAVRAFTSKNQWDHLQNEENAIKRIIEKMFTYFVNAPINE
jgi:hypothetical protein